MGVLHQRSLAGPFDLAMETVYVREDFIRLHFGVAVLDAAHFGRRFYF